MSQPINLSVSRALDERRHRLATLITETHFQAHPELDARYGPIGRTRCYEDAGFHLSYLSEAIANNMPALFADYVAWAKVMLAGRGVPEKDLNENLQVMRRVIASELPEDLSDTAAAFIDAGIAGLPDVPEEPPSHIIAENTLTPLANSYLEALLRGERHLASRLILDAVAAGTSVRDIYLEVFQQSQREIGRLWQLNRITVAQEHYCTAATQLIMSQLYPHIFSTAKNGRTMVAACIGGDLHEIGVRMISDFFEMEGWDTFYLGANNPIAGIVGAVIERRADLLAISATITVHVRGVAELIAAVRKNPACAHVKIIVGGYPFNAAPDLWQTIGADGCARSADEAIALAGTLFAAGGER